jgi:hypothetical protein
VFKRLVHGLLFGLAWIAIQLGRLVPRPATPLRSLWAGSPIINMAINARAERRLGVEADSLVYETYHVTDAFTYDLSRWMRVPGLRTLLPYAVLVWAARRYRRFHFYCDRGLLTPRRPYTAVEAELRLLRRLGAELIFWTYGADVRTTDRTRGLGEPNCCTDCPARGRACICDDARGAANYEVVRRHATAVFSMGDMSEYTPGSVTDVFFWPVDLETAGGRRYEPEVPPDDGAAPLRVVHAANHRAFKGTGHLVAAVERLVADGCPVELTLVERVPNEKALEIYRGADVIFDQCLIGFHGYFAQEAMALGKPVMCFVRRPDAYLLDPEACPIIDTPPDRIEPVLRDLATDRARVRALGERGRAYIERYHTPERFAERLRLAYRRIGVREP